ncbi:hypothetical protein D3C76_1038580 [compost metagenome]
MRLQVLCCDPQVPTECLHSLTPRAAFAPQQEIDVAHYKPSVEQKHLIHLRAVLSTEASKHWTQLMEEIAWGEVVAKAARDANRRHQPK